MKYTWTAASEDGCYEATGKLFATREEAYRDMRTRALEKMKWNTEWEDVDECDSLGYEVHFSRTQISHKSYSGTYIYTLVLVDEKVYLHDRTWEVIDTFTPKAMYDWCVCIIDGVGSLWMNNSDGYVVLIEPSGRILKSDI